LDNNQNFSRDGKWLLYDTRDPGLLESRTIEKVNIETGETVVLYTPKTYIVGQGPGSGAASFSPANDRIAFIHGPWAETGLSYDFTVRRGGLVDSDGTNFAFADARDITPPFTPGALRGGTHRHEWDGTGKWLGFTYNDDLMKKRGVDLRTIGVTHFGTPVQVKDKKEDLFEGDGEGFSVLVVRVTPDPKPGTDEISRAAEDSWIGLNGYKKADGARQLGRAFAGTMKGKNGEELKELFIVDIPDDVTKPGEWGPLEGTGTTSPAPPLGASQRRVTGTESWKHPGVTGTCWSSPEGDWIAFLAKDDSGDDRIVAIRPTGGDPIRTAEVEGGVASSPRWSPDGKRLVAVSKSGRLFVVDAPDPSGQPDSDSIRWLTEQADGAPPEKPVWSPDSRSIAFNRTVDTGKGSFLQIFLLTGRI
jgi:hypothetical protein